MRRQPGSGNMAQTITLKLNGSSATGPYSTQYIVNSGNPVPIDGPNTFISDPGFTNLTSATIVLTNKLDNNDLLSIQGNLASLGIVAAPLVNGASTETLVLTGSASFANYETAFQDIDFSDPGAQPNTTTRIITFSLTDTSGNTSQANNLSQARVSLSVPATATWTGADTTPTNYNDSLNWNPSGPPTVAAMFGTSNYYGTAANPISATGGLNGLQAWDFSSAPQTYYLEIQDNGGNENHFFNGQGIISP